MCFNSRTPGGVRQLCAVLQISSRTFQFTHPGRGATAPKSTGAIDYLVSIHAPREGCDGILLATRGGDGRFQFTHPGRGATGVVTQVSDLTCVSIHAPREGCDRDKGLTSQRTACFNSRTPGGVRHGVEWDTASEAQFQFTHPGRGATQFCGQ